MGMWRAMLTLESAVLVAGSDGRRSGAEGGGPERDERKQGDDAGSLNQPAVGYERHGEPDGKGKDREPSEWRAVQYGGESVCIDLRPRGFAVEAAAQHEAEEEGERGDENGGSDGDADDRRHQGRPLGGSLLDRQAGKELRSLGERPAGNDRRDCG